MDRDRIREILEGVSGHKLSVEEAIQKLRVLPFENIGFATIDHHRALRCGFPEVIYCSGKTIEQIEQIFSKLVEGGGNVLATRADENVYEVIAKKYPKIKYNAMARTIALRQKENELSKGTVGLICAGTSDLPVAEEAYETLMIMDQRVERIYDVGVAGLHRLLEHSEKIQKMNVIIVVAGMEGALPSVVGGMVNVPVIAVPTSVGYGANFGGLSALLGMLTSCASNVAVVNIDNGFSAGYIACLINRLAE